MIVDEKSIDHIGTSSNSIIQLQRKAQLYVLNRFSRRKEWQPVNFIDYYE